MSVTSKNILQKCRVCKDYMHLNTASTTKKLNDNQSQNSVRAREYRSKGCREIAFKQNYKQLTSTAEIGDPQINVISDDELEALLSDQPEVKALNYISENHLFYSVVQILGFLDHSKKAVFQKGWKQFYEAKIEELGETEDSRNQFKAFFSAFNEYMNKMWNPSNQTIGKEIKTVAVDLLQQAEIENDDIVPILSQLGQFLNFLRPYSKPEKIIENEADQEQENEEDKDENDYDLSYLNWTFFDLRKHSILEKQFIVRYVTQARETKLIGVKLHHLYNSPLETTLRMVSEAAVQKIEELHAESGYWIAREDGETIKILDPCLEPPSDSSFAIDLYPRLETETLPLNTMKAVIVFNLSTVGTSHNSGTYLTHKTQCVKYIRLIFTTKLSGRLAKLKEDFRAELKKILLAHSQKSKKSKGKGGMDGNKNGLSSTPISSLSLFPDTVPAANKPPPPDKKNPVQIPVALSVKKRLDLICDAYCLNLDWEKNITDLITSERLSRSEYVVYLPTCSIYSSITKSLTLDSPSGPGVFAENSKSNSNLLFSSSKTEMLQASVTLQPELLIRNEDVELFEALVDGDEDADSECNLAVFQLNSDILKKVFNSGKKFETLRKELFCGRFKLYAMIHGSNQVLCYPTISLEVSKPELAKNEKEEQGDKNDEKIDRKR